jgi:hypothetical protein
MRAIIVNPKDRTITATDIDGSLKTLQQIVGGLIEPVSQGLDEYRHCYVNEEGLLNVTRSLSSCSGTATSRLPAMASSCRRPTTVAKPMHLATRLGQRTRDFHGS